MLKNFGLEANILSFLRNYYFNLKRLGVLLLLRRVSLIRPAPAESPQVRKEARVGGCSGAI